MGKNDLEEKSKQFIESPKQQIKNEELRKNRIISSSKITWYQVINLAREDF